MCALDFGIVIIQLFGICSQKCEPQQIYREPYLLKKLFSVRERERERERASFITLLVGSISSSDEETGGGLTKTVK